MSDILVCERIGSILHAKINAETIFGNEQVSAIKDELLELVENNKRPHLLLDLTNVQDITSSFLALLLDLKFTIDENEGIFKLVSLQTRLSELIELTQLDKSLDIYSTRDKALISFNLDILNTKPPHNQF